MLPVRLRLRSLALPTLWACALLALPRGPLAGDPGTVVVSLDAPAACPADRAVTVVLKAVLADSRCPQNALCVRAGGVRLEVAVRRGEGPAETLVLDTDRGDGCGEACGIRFRVAKVEPARRVGEKLAPESYRVTLAVEAAAGAGRP